MLKRVQQLKDKEAEMDLTLQKILAEERPVLAEGIAGRSITRRTTIDFQHR